jgi:ABC-2 type transport system permease protein
VVATVLRIKFRILGNTLASNPWQLVGFLLGALWGLAVLALAAAGLVAVGFAGLVPAQAVVTGAGALVTLVWVLAPIFISGVDTTIDPKRLAPYPMSTRQIMLALTAGGLAGIPGMLTILGALATFGTWFHWPLAVVGAIVGVPAGVLVCVLAGQLVATLSSGGGSRRTREVASFAIFGVLILAGPIVIGITQLARAASQTTDAGGLLAGILESASWTPLGAAWAAPGDLAAGEVLPGVAKLAIAIATVAVLWLLWRWCLVQSVAHPAQRRVARVAAGKLGWFGRLPTGGAGATWARSMTSWLHDPRYLRQLLIVPLFPVLFLFYSGFRLDNPLFAFSALVVAFFVGVTPYTDVSYDGTAFASVLATGVRGRDDRLGRTLGAASIGLPAVILVAVVTVGLGGAWDALPAVLGASIGLLLTGYAASAISSAYLVVPVPASGENAFKRVPGTTFGMFLSFFVLWIAVAILAAPEVILAIVGALVGSALLSWLSVLVGVVLGGVLLVIGILVGGRGFDRNGPQLLARLRSFKGM